MVLTQLSAGPQSKLLKKLLEQYLAALTCVSADHEAGCDPILCI